MSLDLFERDTRDAISFAGSNLARDFPVTFGEGFETAWNERALFGQSFAQGKARTEALLDYVADLKERTGEDLTPGALGTFNIEGVNTQLEGLKARHPSLDLAPLTEEGLEERAISLSRASREAWREMAEREKTLGGKIGFHFVAPLAAGVVDPINLATFPLAAPAGLGILGTAGAWAGIGGATQTAIEVLGAEFREEVEPGYMASAEPVTNILGAGVAAGGLGATFRAAANAWTRVKTGEWPRSVRDAGNVVERENLTIESNPFPERGIEGEMTHRKALDDAETVLNNNRPGPVRDDVLPEVRTRLDRADADLSAEDNAALRFLDQRLAAEPDFAITTTTPDGAIVRRPVRELLEDNIVVCQ